MIHRTIFIFLMLFIFFILEKLMFSSEPCLSIIDKSVSLPLIDVKSLISIEPKGELLFLLTLDQIILELALFNVSSILKESSDELIILLLILVLIILLLLILFSIKLSFKSSLEPLISFKGINSDIFSVLFLYCSKRKFNLRDESTFKSLLSNAPWSKISYICFVKVSISFFL